MSRKAHDATENIRDIQLVLPNYAVTSFGLTETASGGTLSCSEAWLEYPAGFFQRITFSGGSNSGSSSGDYLTSDLTALARYVPHTHTTTTSVTFAASGETCTRSSGSWIADGFYVGQFVTPSGTASNNAVFEITALSATVMTAAFASFVDETVTATLTGPTRYWTVYNVANTVAMPVHQHTGTLGRQQYLPAGDATQAGGSDHTNVVDDGSLTSVWPSAVLGTTQFPTVLTVGDSRQNLESIVGDSSHDVDGYAGEFQRSIQGRYGTVNISIPGDRTLWFQAAHSKRIQLAKYATHVFDGYGINDIDAFSTAATIEASDAYVREAFADKPAYCTTLAPNTTSTDLWATTDNQTVPNAGNEAQRIALNTNRRGPPSRWQGCIDVANTSEFGGSGAPSGKWNAPGYTYDGLHAADLNNRRIAAAPTLTYTPAVALTAANSNPSLWLEGDVNVTSSGGLVSAWGDQSSNALSATASGALRPGLSTSINGKQCISIVTTNALALPNFTVVGAKTIVLVYKLTGSPGDYEPLTLKDPTGPTLTRLDFISPGTYQTVSFIADAPAGGRNFVGFSPTLDTNAHALILSYLGGTVDVPGNYAATLDAGANAVIASAADGGFTLTDKGSIGARLNSSGAISGGGSNIDIAFIAVWNRILTPDERAGLKLTLAKWGLN